MEINGAVYKEAKEAGEALLDALKHISGVQPALIGKYRGFEIQVHFDSYEKQYALQLLGSARHSIWLGSDARGNITRIDNLLASLPERLADAKERLANTLKQIETGKEEVKKPFPQEDELKGIELRLTELNVLLSLDEKSSDDADIDMEPDGAAAPLATDDRERER